MQERSNISPLQARRRLISRGASRGFTIIEVAIAGFVLATAVISSLYALQMGFKMLETARNSALADQVLQSVIEDLRLKNYAWITAAGNYPGSTTGITYDLTNQLPANVPQGMTLSLTVFTNDPPYKETVTLLVTSTWTNSINKRKLTRSYQTVYSRNGISDYFVSHHTS